MWRGEVDNLCVFTDVNAKPKAGDTRVLCHDALHGLRCFVRRLVEEQEACQGMSCCEQIDSKGITVFEAQYTTPQKIGDA
jgi:hypothetical protein